MIRLRKRDKNYLETDKFGFGIKRIQPCILRTRPSNHYWNPTSHPMPLYTGFLRATHIYLHCQYFLHVGQCLLACNHDQRCSPLKSKFFYYYISSPIKPIWILSSYLLPFWISATATPDEVNSWLDTSCIMVSVVVCILATLCSFIGSKYLSGTHYKCILESLGMNTYNILHKCY